MWRIQTSITGYSISAYDRFRTYDNLVHQFNLYREELEAEASGELDLFAKMIKRVRLNQVIDPRDAILQDREFGGIANSDKILYKGISRNYCKNGPLQSKKWVFDCDLTTIDVKLPLSEKHERGAQHGGARFSGNIAQTEDWDGSLGEEGQGVVVDFPFNFRSCHSILCSVCGEKAILDRAWNLSESLWARTQYLKINGEDPHVFEIVFSPDQRTKEKLVEVINKSEYKEGLDDWVQGINYAIRSALSDIGADRFGWVVFYHHVRGNGSSDDDDAEARRKKNDWNGNDGNPNNFRRAPHFHVLLISPLPGGELIKRFNKVRAEALPGWIVKVGPNKEESRRARKEGRAPSPVELKTRFSLEDKLAYIMSHQGVTFSKTVKGSRTIQDDLWRSYGICSGRVISEICIKPRVPLLNQGYVKYVEVDGERKPLFWSKLLFMCMDQGLDVDLAHVEGINSARVFVHRSDKKDCLELVQAYYKENPDNLEGLYELIRKDRRFLFDFIPKDG